MDTNKVSICLAKKRFFLKSSTLFVVFFVFCFVLPLSVFLNKFLYPDLSFDTINYHLFLPWKFFSIAGNVDFFPTGLQNFPPFIEVFGYLFRKLLGYRLGTVSNLIVYFMIVLLSIKIILVLNINKYFFNSFFALFIFILAIFNFEALSQISTYYNDLPSAFIVLVALYFFSLFLTLTKNKFLFFSSFFFGLSFFLKNTNIIYTLPFIFFLFYFFLDRKIGISSLFMCVLLILLPSSHFLFVNFTKSSNPFFPFYNAFFNSPYALRENFQNGNFGGRSVVEIIFWPVFSILHQNRLSELSRFYFDNRLTYFFLTTVVAILFLPKKINKTLLILSAYCLLCFFTWSLLFGYSRYFIAMEFFSGVVASAVYQIVVSEKSHNLLISFFFFIFFLLNIKDTYMSALTYDWSWRGSYIDNQSNYISQKKFLFENTLITGENVDETKDKTIYLNCSLPSLGYLVVSDLSSMPVYNIDKRSYGQLTGSEKYMNMQRAVISGKVKMKNVYFYSMVSPVNLNDCKLNIINLGGKIENEKEIDNFLGYKYQRIVLLEGSMPL